MYKISIIIPVYNAEKTLNRAIDSVINQSFDFKNLELILVDDYSKDNSREIISQYSSIYENIIPIFLNENHGFPGYGRNIGIKNASSDYIMFIDNDDEFDLKICEKLYSAIVNNHADIVSCDFKDIDDDNKYVYRDGVNIDENMVVNKFNGKPVYYDDILIWNKIFKKSIIDSNNIRFVENGVNEDSLFCLEYFLNSDNLFYIENYYGYIHHITGDNLSLATFDYTIKIIKSYYEIYKIIKNSDKNINMNEIFNSRVQKTIERTILMPESNFSLIKEIFTEVYNFEKYTQLQIPKLDNFIINCINSIIFHNHLFFASLIIFLLNKIAKINQIKNFYRKYIN